MKVIVRDAASLNALRPTEIASYLRSRGWRQAQYVAGSNSLWEISNGSDVEILLPLNAAYYDYARRISEILDTLEVVERRSQLEILADIQVTTSDVIRIHLQNSAYENGSVPLEDGMRFVEHTREMLIAAACSTIQPKPAYYSRKPAEVANYLATVRLAQTERGSYVLALHSPVPPRLSNGGQGSLFQTEDLPEGDDDPLERKIVLRLAHSLAYTTQAIEQAVALGDFAPFKDAVEHGVSANLCEALAGLSASERTQSTSVRISWASVRMVSSNTPSRFRISEDASSTLKEAARLLRASAPRDDFELLGLVVALRREGDAPNRILVTTTIDDRPRYVTLELSPVDYQIAIRAHDNETPIRCEGDLLREGRSYRLRSPHNFRLVSGS